jgi:hydrogenase maturation protein HypF
MAENNYLEPLIGVSFDGTGYGDDGTIWGGEIFTADMHQYCRSASIKPFYQLGGDASAKEGWRIAVSMIYALTGCNTEKTWRKVQDLQLCDEAQLQAQLFLYDHHINSVLSTSAGRLFDAVSAIAGLCRASTFEGDASMQLQFAAESWEERQGIRPVVPVAPQQGKQRWLLPTDVLVTELVRRRLDGALPEQLAYDFHVSLAGMIIGAVEELRHRTGRTTVALSGGVFQNRLLLRFTDTALQDRGFTVLRHHVVPPNDGGIALGQAVYAAMNRKD